MNNKNLFNLLLLLFLSISSYSQEEVIENIKSQAELVIKAVFNENYDDLAKFTHPNLIEFVGGRETFISIIEGQMKDFKTQGVVFEKVVIGDSIRTALYKNEYHAIVPKTMILSINGQKIGSDSFLFGFSDSEGKKWTFVEAEKLLSEEAKLIFPDFETDLKIPKENGHYLIEQ